MQDIVLLLLRIVIGLLFIGHAYQKYKTHESFISFMNALNVPIPSVTGNLVIVFEFIGGLLFILGLGTVLAPLMLISVLSGAIKTVHWKLSPWVTDNGYEYCLVLIFINFLFLFSGYGTYSLDYLLWKI